MPNRHVLRRSVRVSIPSEYRHAGARRRRDPDRLPGWLVTLTWPLRDCALARGALLVLLAYPLSGGATRRL